MPNDALTFAPSLRSVSAEPLVQGADHASVAQAPGATTPLPANVQAAASVTELKDAVTGNADEVLIKSAADAGLFVNKGEIKDQYQRAALAQTVEAALAKKAQGDPQAKKALDTFHQDLANAVAPLGLNFGLKSLDTHGGAPGATAPTVDLSGFEHTKGALIRSAYQQVNRDFDEGRRRATDGAGDKSSLTGMFGDRTRAATVGSERQPVDPVHDTTTFGSQAEKELAENGVVTSLPDGTPLTLISKQELERSASARPSEEATPPRDAPEVGSSTRETSSSGSSSHRKRQDPT